MMEGFIIHSSDADVLVVAEDIKDAVDTLKLYGRDYVEVDDIQKIDCLQVKVFVSNTNGGV